MRHRAMNTNDSAARTPTVEHRAADREATGPLVMSRSAVIVVAVLCALGLVVGCSGSDDSQQNADKAGSSVSTSPGGSSGDPADGGITPIDNNAPDPSEPPTTQNANAPKAWPADIPLPSDIRNVVDSSVDMDGKKTIIVGGMTDLSTDQIQSLYYQALAGWKQTSSKSDSVNGIFVIQYELDGRKLVVNISTASSTRMLNLSYMPA